MKPPAVLFDFDGVIVDSFNSHHAAWADAFKIIFDYDMPVFSREHLTGAPSAAIGQYIAESAEQPEKTNELCTLKLELLLSGQYFPALLPGVTTVFEYLHNNAIPFGIASNAPREYVNKAVNHHTLSCPLVLGFGDFKQPKPDPDPYLTCAEKLGIDKHYFSKIIVFEDSEPGITAVVNANMIPVGIASGFTAAKLSELGAVRIFENLRTAFEGNVFSD